MLRFLLAITLCCLIAPTLQGQRLTLDASHRMRYVSWDDGLWGRDRSQVQFTRNRTRAGLTWRPTGTLELRAALVNEFFHWMKYPTDRPTKPDEVAFEHLYLRWSDTLGMPLRVTLGRQDFRLGDGFLIMDGTPLDGSRSLYVNAARVDCEIGPRHTLTLFALHQPERDDLLPVLNDQERPLAEYERDIAGLSYTGTFDGTQLEASVLRGTGGHDVFVHTQRYMILTIRSLTLGLLARQELPWGLHATGELARQYAEIHDRGFGSCDVDGTALRAELAWTAPEDVLFSPRLSLSAYRYPTDWEPLLGRWPMWNESLVFSRDIMVAPGYWKNLESLLFGMEIRPFRVLRVAASLQFLRHVGWGWEEGSWASSIGRLLTMHVFWRPDLPISAHFMLERMWYDDSYVAARGKWMKESYLWGRVEVMVALREVLAE